MEKRMYTAQDIRTTTCQEAILKRPAMYLGNLDQRGCVRMIANVIRELLERHPGEIQLEIKLCHKGQILMSIQKIDFDLFQKSLDGQDMLDLLLLITLSSAVTIQLDLQDQSISFKGNKGILTQKMIAAVHPEEKVMIDFTPDPSIFEENELNYETLNTTLRRYALLNPRLEITSIEQREQLQRNVFHYPKGIFQEMDFELSKLNYGEAVLRLDIEAEINYRSYTISICYTNTWPDKSLIKTYAGDEALHKGSLQDGILDGIIAGAQSMTQEKIKTRAAIFKNHLFMIASVHSRTYLNHEGSYKGILKEPEIRKEVREIVAERMKVHLTLNPDLCWLFVAHH